MYIKHHLDGRRFGKLLVLRLSTEDEKTGIQRMWFCQCDCGKTKHIRQDALLNGKCTSCGCVGLKNLSLGWWKRRDLLGQRFGRLLVIEDLGKGKNDHYFWRCKCDCGNIVVVKSGHLSDKSGGVKSCGCLLTDFNKQHQLAFGEASFNDLYRSYMTGAEIRNLSFTLDKDQFAKITKESCHYCGKEPSAIKRGTSYYGYYVFNGIDRVDNTKGYEIDNCVACCKTCNYMKRNLKYDEFIGQTLAIAKKHGVTNA